MVEINLRFFEKILEKLTCLYTKSYDAVDNSLGM